MLIMKNLVITIHNTRRCVAVLTLMVLADSPLSCKTKFDSFALTKVKILPPQAEKRQNPKLTYLGLGEKDSK